MTLILMAAALILCLGALGLALGREAGLDRELRELAGRAALGSLVPGLAHRWRQPLNVLSLALQAMEFELESGRPDSSALAGPLGRGLAEIEGLDRLLEDYRRLASPRSDLAAGSFLLRELLELCLRLEAPGLEGLRVKVELSCPEGLHLRGEPGLLAAVLIGALEEGLAAAKTADTGSPTLVLEAEAEGQGLRLRLGLPAGPGPGPGPASRPPSGPASASASAPGSAAKGGGPAGSRLSLLLARRGLGARVSRGGRGREGDLILHLPPRLLA